MKFRFYLFFLLCLWFWTPAVADKKTSRPKIGVVLSGGGAKGLAHIGILKAIEDLGIPIDYISGTSMGAIVGGLYALGYSAKELDSIIRYINWNQLLSDAPVRSHTGVAEKLEQDRYQLRLRFQDKGISLIPKGALKGQNIDNLFYTLSLPSYKLKNFSDFPIPFFCVGTDLTTGKEVILDSGNLALSMRASMAVPTIFSPAELNGKLLADGGLVNNFPTLETRKRGADIIIGVDVGYQYLKKENVQNISNVLMQVLFLPGMDLNNKNIEACDIYIHPKLDKYGAYSFNMVDSILEAGYQAAEKAYPQLEALAKELKTKYKLELKKKDSSFLNIQNVYIDSIIYTGCKKYSKEFVAQRLQIPIKREVSIHRINAGIERLYGSLLYEKASYSLSPASNMENHAILHLEVKEAMSNELNLGVRFDNTRSASLLVGLSFHNLGFRNSSLNIALDVSAIPTIKINYSFTPTWQKEKSSYIRPSLGISYLFYNLNAYSYSDSLASQRMNEYFMIGQRGALYAKFNFRNNILGISTTFDYSYSKPRFGENPKGENIFYFYPSVFYLFNNYNQKFFPTRGCRMEGNVRFPVNLGSTNKEYNPFFASAFFKGEYAIPLGKRFTLFPGFTIGATFFRKTDYEIPFSYYIMQGGLISFDILNYSPFIGLDFLQKGSLYAANLKLNLQAYILKNFYLTARFAVGKAEDDPIKMLRMNDLIFGGGLTVSYATPVGPLGLTFETSNYKNFGAFINFGYWF